MTQRGHSVIRVFEGVTRIALQLIARNGLVQLVHGVVREGILGLRRCKILRHVREAGKVGREIEQRDRLSVTGANMNVGRQQIRNRIGKLDLATPHHVREQDSGEYLGHGTDLEHTLTINRQRTAPRITMSDHAPRPGFVHQAYDDASDSVAICQLPEHSLNARVRWE